MYIFGKEILLMKVRKEVKEAMEVLGIDRCRRRGGKSLLGTV